MLITKTIKVLNRSHYKYYLDKGHYNNDDNTIEFDIIHLKPTSPIEVDVKCDICGIEKKTSYLLYVKNIGNYNFYTCKGKCSQVKNKKTCLERYGFENSSQNEKIKEKSKQTCIDKYGVDNYAKTDEFLIKSKETFLDKYGVENPFQNEKIKIKIKGSNLDKYGVEYTTQRKDIKVKIKKTILDKYCVDNYTKTDEYKIKSKETSLDKFGVEHYSKTEEFKEKSKKTNLDKYGVDSYSKTEEFKEKSKKTNLDKYGVDNYAKTDEYKIKSKETNLEKYGVDNYSKTDDYKIKSKETNLDKYGVEHYTKSEESRVDFIITKTPNYIKYINNGISLYKCDNNKDHEFEIKSDNFLSRLKSNLPLCTICFPIGDNKSIKEGVLLEYIRFIYTGEIISGYRDGIEIDIYLPDLNLGIEFNGIYWHSDKFKKSDYHINKLNYFKNKGINIRFIWEDDFNNNIDIIKSQIKNWLGKTDNRIYARKTIVKIVNSEEYRKFLDNNHIQGYVSSKLSYGLYYNDKLVSLMNFDKKEGRLNMGETQWNLNRFCNLLDHQIIGGASKLLKHFIKENKPSRIVSYADKDWSNGDLYFTLGFNLVSESKPDYKYIIDDVRKSKQNFTKPKLEKMGYDISLTEAKIMGSIGINRIYDCGKMKFEKLLNIYN